MFIWILETSIAAVPTQTSNTPTTTENQITKTYEIDPNFEYDLFLSHKQVNGAGNEIS